VRSLLVEVNRNLPDHLEMVRELAAMGYRFDPEQVRRAEPPRVRSGDAPSMSSSAELHTLYEIANAPPPECPLDRFAPFLAQRFGARTPDLYNEAMGVYECTAITLSARTATDRPR
jgi:hypothetical protein